MILPTERELGNKELVLYEKKKEYNASLPKCPYNSERIKIKDQLSSMKNMPIKKSYPASLTKITSNPMYKEQSISRIQSIQSIPSVSKLPKILTKMDDSLLSNIARSYKNNDALSNVNQK